MPAIIYSASDIKIVDVEFKPGTDKRIFQWHRHTCLKPSTVTFEQGNFSYRETWQSTNFARLQGSTKKI
jgi:hypothetical protein